MTLDAQLGALVASPAWGALAPGGAGDSLRETLLVNATYAWLGDDATLAAWPDLVAGVNAAPGGAGTTLGSLNGRPAPIFNGSGYYRTAAFAAGPISQAYAAVVVSRITGSVAGVARGIFDGLDATNRCLMRHQLTTGYPLLNAGSSIEGSTAAGGSPQVWRATVNGASSSLHINGAQAASGNAGTQSIAGANIGTAYNSSSTGFVGPVALVALVAGAGYAARAGAIEAAARAYYGI